MAQASSRGGFRTKTQMAYEDLRQRIRDGRLKPGERLRLRDLSADLGVSQVPIREALRHLHGDGLVELDPHRGARVRVVTWDVVREMLMIRMHLEVLAAREALPDHDDASVAAVRRELERMEEAASENDLLGLSRHNREFHRALYEPAQHPLLKRTIEDLWDHVWRVRPESIYVAMPERGGGVLAEHAAILRALEHRDPVSLVAVMEEHRQATLEAVAKLATSGTGALAS